LVKGYSDCDKQYLSIGRQNCWHQSQQLKSKRNTTGSKRKIHIQ